MILDKANPQLKENLPCHNPMTDNKGEKPFSSFPFLFFSFFFTRVWRLEFSNTVSLGFLARGSRVCWHVPFKGINFAAGRQRWIGKKKAHRRILTRYSRHVRPFQVLGIHFVTDSGERERIDRCLSADSHRDDVWNRDQKKIAAILFFLTDGFYILSNTYFLLNWKITQQPF